MARLSFSWVQRRPKAKEPRWQTMESQISAREPTGYRRKSWSMRLWMNDELGVLLVGNHGPARS